MQTIKYLISAVKFPPVPNIEEDKTGQLRMSFTQSTAKQ